MASQAKQWLVHRAPVYGRDREALSRLPTIADPAMEIKVGDGCEAKLKIGASQSAVAGRRPSRPSNFGLRR